MEYQFDQPMPMSLVLESLDLLANEMSLGDFWREAQLRDRLFVLRLGKSDWWVDMYGSNLCSSNEFVVVDELRQHAQSVL